MIRFLTLVASTALVILAAFFTSPVFAHSIPAAKPPANENFPFKPGEQLVFDLSWSKFVYAGVGRLSVAKKSEFNGLDSFIFKIEGWTIGFVSRIYKVRDITTAWFDIENRRTLFTDIRISENNYRKHKTITFDHKNNEVEYKINNHPAESYKIVKGAFGPISALYVFRYIKKKRIIGEIFSIPLFDDRKMYNLTVTITGKERLILPIGEVNTVKTVVDLKTEGVFRRKGKMTVWFSDDKTFAPVQINTELPIGSMFATLREFAGARLDALTPSEILTEKTIEPK